MSNQKLFILFPEIGGHPLVAPIVVTYGVPSVPTRIVLIKLCQTLLFDRHYNGCILLLLSLLHCKALG